MNKTSGNTLHTLSAAGKTFHYYSLKALETELPNIAALPFTLKILLENVLRHEESTTAISPQIQAFFTWLTDKKSNAEIAFRPSRVLMQDFTGVPGIADLAAMRDLLKKSGGDPNKINPLSRVDLVIDHSVQVDHFGTPQALLQNTALEMKRNQERYQFLRWGQKAFHNFRVVPPGTGICHQVNLEYLADGVTSSQQGQNLYAYPDTVVGTDSHTTMINGLGVLGWGVGGIEAEASMLGQPISMLIPEVVGVCLKGKLKEGITATDLVLSITQMLRAHGVVGKFVEFYGEGLQSLPLADRATIANMAPEYGATCGYFPIDKETLRYLTLTGRNPETIALVETYAKAQGLWHDQHTSPPLFTETLTLDLDQIEPTLAGPRRPQDKVHLQEIPKAFEDYLTQSGLSHEKEKRFPVPNETFTLQHGDLVIAAITSCTNTSNPGVLMTAGLLAKKAIEKGLQTKPWVKASLAPGSKVVTDYLKKAGLQPYLDSLGFQLVGYGCTTCIGNSGPLPAHITETIQNNNLVVGAILSGNRNFEGRIHPLVKTNWLASPPLVVAYALAGNTRIDLSKDSLGQDKQGNPVYLKDLWPSNAEIQKAVDLLTQDMFKKEYAEVFQGDEAWRAIPVHAEKTYDWDPTSTYIQLPPFFTNMERTPAPPKNIEKARILAILGDSITTDHISPAGSIKTESPAGQYLISKGVTPLEFNSYGARRGNHEVMVRGTFANIRIRNEMLDNVEGGYTRHYPNHETLTIYDAAERYQKSAIPLIIIAGKEYGSGSSRDWAAKGPLLLGVKAVIAESFERIHRSNLIGMGILPLEFTKGTTRKTLKFSGEEEISIQLPAVFNVKQTIQAEIISPKGRATLDLLCRIDTQDELEYYRNGGILQYVLRKMAG